VTGLGVASVSSVSSASGASSGLTVSLQPCPAPGQLAPEWQALEAQAEPSFFTSWAWIACWLAHLRPEQRPALVRVHRGPELVGLGVLLQQAKRRQTLLRRFDRVAADAAGLPLYAGTAQAGELPLGDGQTVVRGVTGPEFLNFNAPAGATNLFTLVRELGHDVLDIAATRTEAVDAVARRTPGLVLADIQLADGSSGIDAVKDILAKFDVPVIFITAFPERLLTGERPEPTFLITKPFQPETVKAAIGQALFFHPRRTAQAA
jgi:CheY-like chemotaxis protein